MFSQIHRIVIRRKCRSHAQPFSCWSWYIPKDIPIYIYMYIYMYIYICIYIYISNDIPIIRFIALPLTMIFPFSMIFPIGSNHGSHDFQVILGRFSSPSCRSHQNHSRHRQFPWEIQEKFYCDPQTENSPATVHICV